VSNWGEFDVVPCDLAVSVILQELAIAAGKSKENCYSEKSH